MLYAGWYWPVLYCINLGGFGMYLAAANDVSQIVNFSHTKFTLTQFHVQYVLTEVVKDTSEMTLMPVIASTVYYDIVKVHKYKAILQI